MTDEGDHFALLAELASQGQDFGIAAQLVGHETAGDQQADEVGAFDVVEERLRGCRIAVLSAKRFHFRAGKAGLVTGLLQAQPGIPQFQVFVEVIHKSENRSAHGYFLEEILRLGQPFRRTLFPRTRSAEHLFGTVFLARPSLGMTRAEGPAHTSLGQRPRSRAPPKPPSANGAAQFPKSVSAGCSFHVVPTNHSAELPRRIPAVAAKAWDRIPRALYLGLQWNALSALWPRPSDYPARWAGLV